MCESLLRMLGAASESEGVEFLKGERLAMLELRALCDSLKNENRRLLAAVELYEKGVVLVEKEAGLFFSPRVRAFVERARAQSS